MSDNEHAIYEFEGFRLDTRRRELGAPGRAETIPLKPRQYDALLFFLEHAGELIDKRVLMQALWPDTVVEENNLNQHITALRQLLGEDRGGRRFIMNVRGRGYRFVPEVMRLDPSLRALPRLPTMSGAPTSSTAAWQCYQHAMFLVGMDDPAQWRSGIERLVTATRLDPDFASALAALATIRLRVIATVPPDSGEALELAHGEATRAVCLRPDLASPRVAAASVAAARRDWVSAEENFQAALTLDEEWPGVRPLHAGHLLIVVGHLSRALATLESAEAQVHGMIGVVLIHAVAHMLAGNLTEVRRFADLMLAMGARPHQPQIRAVFVWLARAEGRLQDAIDLLNADQAPHMTAAGAESVIADVVRALAGEASATRGIDALDRLLASVEIERLPTASRRFMLLSYAELGALDRAHSFALRNVELFASQGTMFWSCLWHAEIRAFRRDARFEALASRLRLGDYWERFGGPN